MAEVIITERPEQKVPGVPPIAFTFKSNQPVEISITVANQALRPVITALTRPQSEENLPSGRNGSSSSPVMPPPPFLPLQPSFDYMDVTFWQDLAQDTQDWLVTLKPSEDVELWTWSLDIFWIAFVAAYPDFPAGDWPDWDNRVPLRGNFIMNWVSGGGRHFRNHDSNPSELDGTSRHLYFLWTFLGSVINSRYPDLST
ncbi:hypothetical protein M407DRAFT_246798 [Tulasnella calospora MUT 4182]|uniref:Uncharacterized protein n=1 Tax=Tulasnella calospora MUT 4182 TaxID=1051891 RepID=A0A0C3Q2D4_9AGAM|nr:hypothetical protein M407DRAFT_246959 [Tulasnella calospora MUT 4182]KIO17255.1 hypothetical protein M407DRAFT_246798 [Tulasnella calospora MUT 4182]